MPWVAGQSGNPDGNPKGKPWAGALRRAIAEADRDQLLEIAKAVLAKAAEGDIGAVKEVGDRLDGRVPQTLDANVKGHMTVSIASTDADL